MTVLFFILILLAAGILGFLVLIQNPKGGGLSGTFGGFGNQIMGVKQTNDVLEKGTWIFAGVVGLLCIFSSMFFSGSTATNPGSDVLKNLKTNSSNTAPATTPDANQPNTVPLDSNQK